MRSTVLMLTLAACSLSASGTKGAPDTAGKLESRITSIGLFKNGLAVVRRELVLPGNGTWELHELPEPVHGTFWLESDATIEARMTLGEVEEPPGSKRLGGDLQSDLAGRRVTLSLRDEQEPVVEGRVLAYGEQQDWSRHYEPPAYRHWSSWYSSGSTTAQSPISRFLALESQGRLLYIDRSSIARIEVDRASVTRRRPVMRLSVSGAPAGGGTVSISYLTKGLAWAPSYRVDLQSPEKLSIEQQAVLKNELEDFEGAELKLISGFPSVEFSHVLSPVSLATDWASFFTQLNQRIGQGSARSQVVSQQAVLYNAPAAGPVGASDVIPTGEGVDIHYQPVGRRSMLGGDSLMLSVARGEADYERVVEWLIPDNRDENGTVENWQRQQDAEKYQDAAWDAVRFVNPFEFPMTTGPAMIVDGGRFGGQRLSPWVSPGERTTLRITKALSIRSSSGEQEEPGEREILHVGGRRFRRPTVRGELRVTNHRREAVTLVVRRRFSGDLLEAEGSPEQSLREEGVYSINPRHELTWTLTLQPGQEQVLSYRYSVLVPH